MVIDVRPDDRIETRDAEAFEATRLACEAVGWAFRRLSTPDPALLANVRWLSRYRHPRCGARTETVARLREVFACPTGLFAGAGQVGERLGVLPLLFHLMWRQILVCDLGQGLLGAGSVLQVAGDGPR